MAFLLGRGTAVEWLRQNRNLAIVRQPWMVPYPLLEGSRTRLERVLPNLAGLSVPYQLIVWTREDRRRTALAQSHVVNLHEGHYPALRIAEELFVCTPEFTFLQMASVLDDDHLLFLGCELCGRYGIRDDEVFMREQTRTPRDLIAFAENTPRIRGRRHALLVAPSVLPGAGSPMEAALARLCSHACGTWPCIQGSYRRSPKRPQPVRGRRSHRHSVGQFVLHADGLCVRKERT